MKIHQYPLLLFLYLMSTPINANESLVDIYQSAQQNNPTLKAAEMAYLAVIASKPQVQALKRPNVSLSSNYTQTWQMASNIDTDSSGYQLSVTQALFNRVDDVQLSQMDNQIAQAQLTFQLAQKDFMLLLANYYFDVLIAQAALEAAQQTKQSSEQQWLQMQQRFEVGLIAITDVHEAKARLDQAIADEIQQQVTLDNAYMALSEETGQHHHDLSVDLNVADLDAVFTDESADTWVQQALEYNLQLQIAQLALQNALQEIKRHRKQHLPTLDLVAQHSYNETDMTGYRHDNSVGIQLKWLVYSGGAIDSQIEQAHKKHEQALFNLEKQRRSLKRQVRQAHHNLMATRSQITALQQALLSSQTAYEATQAGFDVGTRTAVDVLNSQRDVRNAQRNYHQATYRFLLAILQLKHASGVFSDQDLQQLSVALASSSTQ